MSAAVLLCAALLAAGDPDHVQVKVLYGAGPPDEQRADIEPWISRAATEAGSRVGCKNSISTIGAGWGESNAIS